MNQTQKTKQTILGGNDPASTSGLKRQAPESSGLLKELDSAIKQKDQKSERDAKRRRILERCGCL